MAPHQKTVALVLAALLWIGTDFQIPRVPDSPIRIVSLVPAVTEMLFAIGAGPGVVAVSSYDTYPPEVTKLPNVGALLDPNVERILSLQPALVIVYGSQTDLKAQLARAGIGVFEYRHGGLAQVTATLRTDRKSVV